MDVPFLLSRLTEEEKKVYDEVFSFSQEAMISYMKRHQEKEEDKALMAHVEGGGRAADFKFRPPTAGGRGGMAEEEEEGGSSRAGQRRRPFGDGKEVKAHHLLVLLLRLRQICCHPGLIKSMLDSEARSVAGSIENKELGEEGADEDLISQLADMSIGKTQEEEEVKSVLNLDNPVFKGERESSKIAKVVEELEELKRRQEETGVMEKAVVVSQWTSMLVSSLEISATVQARFDLSWRCSLIIPVPKDFFLFDPSWREKTTINSNFKVTCASFEF